MENTMLRPASLVNSMHVKFLRQQFENFTTWSSKLGERSGGVFILCAIFGSAKCHTPSVVATYSTITEALTAGAVFARKCRSDEELCVEEAFLVWSHGTETAIIANLEWFCWPEIADASSENIETAFWNDNAYKRLITAESAEREIFQKSTLLVTRTGIHGGHAFVGWEITAYREPASLFDLTPDTETKTESPKQDLSSAQDDSDESECDVKVGGKRKH